MIKIPVRTSSWIAAILCWLLLSALTFFIIGGLRDRARLIRDNENEQILNMLFTGLRGYDDFGSAIEANPALRERIAGVAAYGAGHTPVYQWGRVPPVLDTAFLQDKLVQGRNGRYTIPDPKGRSVKFVLRTDRPSPPRGTLPDAPPPHQDDDHRDDERRRRNPPRQQSSFFTTLAAGDYFYIDIFHPVYWRTQTLTAILLPFSCLALLALVIAIRRLFVRNGEYRERIEAQKNLVVLGTAAATLAHEIKNPLSSIRLQTGILSKLFSDRGTEEVAIINEEVDRLSALIYRVNDYLREAAGNPAAVNAGDILAETGRRLCGRNIIAPGSAAGTLVFADADRLRSVFENLIRNALESGGKPEDAGASIEKNDGVLVITIFDRGTGIDETDRQRVFDPFFTRKSTGTGIGLSISKRFVEAAGGTIALDNREGGGTAVRITLPLTSE